MDISVFISGSGTNMEALVRRWREGGFSRVDRVAFVLSDKADAPGIEKARRYGVETIVVPRRKGEAREQHEERILSAIAPFSIDILVLAGFMRVLSPSFIRRFGRPIINIHPFLLTAFSGVNAQEQAFNYGVKVSGCTVHFVDESLDGGPIILQRAVERYDGDTAEDLRLRILAEEHRLLGEAVEIVTTGRYRIEKRYVHITEENVHES